MKRVVYDRATQQYGADILQQNGIPRIADQKGDASLAERERQLARQGWSKADAVFLAQNFKQPTPSLWCQM